MNVKPRRPQNGPGSSLGPRFSAKVLTQGSQIREPGTDQRKFGKTWRIWTVRVANDSFLDLVQGSEASNGPLIIAFDSLKAAVDCGLPLSLETLLAG